MAWKDNMMSGNKANFASRKREMQTPPPIIREDTMMSLHEEDSTETQETEFTEKRATMPGLVANIGVSQLTGENINRTFPSIQEKTKEYLRTEGGQKKFKAAVLKANILKKLKSREGDARRSSLLAQFDDIELIPRSLFERPGDEYVTLTSLEKFRRTAKLVGIVLMAITSTRKENERREAKYLSFSQLQDEMQAKQTAYGDGLDFDPAFFKANKEQYISYEAREIMKMSPGSRSQEQLHIALVSLNQAVEQFSEFPIKMQRDLVERGWYERFEAKRVIIRQGHYADNFYFILSGTSVVTILMTNKDTGEQFNNTVAFLKKGNSFGELALMYGGTRNATVSCKNDMELLCVSRDSFVDIFMHVDVDAEPEHIKFVRTIPSFDGWPVNKLPYSDPKTCLFTFFRRGVVMCKDSNQNDWIYIVKSGTCRVLKLLNRATPNMSILTQMTNDLKASTNHVNPELAVRENEDHKTTIERIYDQKHTESTLWPRPPGRSKLGPDKCFAELQKLGPKDMFGLVPIAFQLMEMEMMSLTLVSDGAECVLINKKFFLLHLTDMHRKKLRRTIQPYPTENSVQQKFQDHVNWEAYKRLTLNKEIIHNQKLHDTLLPSNM